MRVAYLLLTPVNPTFRTEIQKSFLGRGESAKYSTFQSNRAGGKIGNVCSFSLPQEKEVYLLLIAEKLNRIIAEISAFYNFFCPS